MAREHSRCHNLRGYVEEAPADFFNMPLMHPELLAECRNAVILNGQTLFSTLP